MHCAQHFRVLAALLALILSLTQASPNSPHLVKRQQSSSRSRATVTETTVALSTTVFPTTASTAPTTAASSQRSTTAVSTTPPSSTPSSPSSSPSSTPSSAPTSSPPTTPAESSTPAPSPQTTTLTIVTQDANGNPTSIISERVSTPSPTPSLPGGSGSSTSGIDEKTRNIIIGVVVGVGGAIILAVVGLVAWRIWGRKKPESAGPFIIGDTPDKTTEPTIPVGSASSRTTPFHSTLESYHAPTQVNTASNF